MSDIGSIIKTDTCEYKILELIGRGANTAAYLAERKSGDLTSKCILKEYSPKFRDKLTADEYEYGKVRFITSGKTQNDIRQLSVLNNQTPPVSYIFETDNTAYIDVSCYGGTVLSRLTSLTPIQYLEICRTIAKTISYYHNSGYLCLDVKPENIFIIQNAPDDTITQLVEFIDFDSIRKISELGENATISCTKGWAAPELLNPYGSSKIGPQADIYTMGELVFHSLFGKHSTENEHRGFSKYPFSECKKEYRKYVDRPDIRSLFSKLFRGTLRSSASNRCNDINKVITILDELISAFNINEYIIPKFPPVSPNFVGRNEELKEISASLKENSVLFITGIGGIGKSSLVKNFIHRNRTDYDVIVYLEYTGTIISTFADDKQLQISTVHLNEGETLNEYYERKLSVFKNICGDKRVLLVIDNYSGRISKDLSILLDCGYDTIIASRNEPPKNSFPYMIVDAISDNDCIYGLIALNLGRRIQKEERPVFDKIISLVQGHTLTIELIARQIAAGHMDVTRAYELIRENGFSHFSERKIDNYKDGEEVYDTLSTIISALFNAGNMNAESKDIIKILSFLDVRGLDSDVIYNILKLDTNRISELAKEGWLYEECWSETGNFIRLHPVISETVRSWSWENSDDISVMSHLKNLTDVYVGAGNVTVINQITKEALAYCTLHPRHIIKAMYYDMLGCYYDVLCNGNYSVYINEDSEPIDKMLEAIRNSIKEAEQSGYEYKNKYLAKYYLDLASVMIRCVDGCGEEVSELLQKVNSILHSEKTEYTDNHCYYNMVSAWYYTLIKPDLDKTLELTAKAKEIAYKVFPTELEIIDIIYIPTANCLIEHNEILSCTEKLEEAVQLCRKYPDTIRYIDKESEILLILIDVYYHTGEPEKCRDSIRKLEKLNETYKEQGIFREIPSEIRDQINKL